ncbi:MAG: hypothetical protein CM1200mP2_37820 [Planctomycetaceae bacterium]|nr:MAG: hypothetical protein CM1200mP2_37820 [Planctomycetaceae bacterium]
MACVGDCVLVGKTPGVQREAGIFVRVIKLVVFLFLPTRCRRVQVGSRRVLKPLFSPQSALSLASAFAFFSISLFRLANVFRLRAMVSLLETKSVSSSNSRGNLGQHDGRGFSREILVPGVFDALSPANQQFPRPFEASRLRWVVKGNRCWLTGEMWGKSLEDLRDHGPRLIGIGRSSGSWRRFRGLAQAVEDRRDDISRPDDSIDRKSRVFVAGTGDNAPRIPPPAMRPKAVAPGVSPALPLILGVWPNSPCHTTSVSSRSPRCRGPRAMR